MTDSRTVVMEMASIEAVHLADLVQQFQDLLATGDDAAPADPAVARLTPDPYPGDPAAAREFGELTHADLLRRRADDAGVVLRSLFPEGAPLIADFAEADALRPLVIVLEHEEVQAWLRTLTAVRLVLASRLGITSEQDHDDDDPRYGVYEWVGMRLEGLVEAADAEPSEGQGIANP